MGEREISTEDLVKRTEIPKARIERFLRAEAEPTARDLLRLASALEARVEQLLERISWESDGKGGGSIRVDGLDDGD